MNNILLIQNNRHPGIKIVSDGYCRALQFYGIDFDYLEFRGNESTWQINEIICSKLCSLFYKKVIFIQPTYMNANLYQALSKIKKDIEFISINTEDPYSTSAYISIGDLFKYKFTNEKLLADRNNIFKYLPVAFDSLQPFMKSKEHYNITCISTLYNNRVKLLYRVSQLEMTKYISGFPASMNDMIYPQTFDKFMLKIIPHHIELGIYDNSDMIFNPHRESRNTGKSYLTYNEGEKCFPIFEEAISPNPRFFDSLACGAKPIVDVNRSECFAIAAKYGLDIIPVPLEDDFDILEKELVFAQKQREDKRNDLLEFSKKETYIERAKEVMNLL